jgi:hypothetical protein
LIHELRVFGLVLVSCRMRPAAYRFCSGHKFVGERRARNPAITAPAGEDDLDFSGIFLANENRVRAFLAVRISRPIAFYFQQQMVPAQLCQGRGASEIRYVRKPNLNVRLGLRRRFTLAPPSLRSKSPSSFPFGWDSSRLSPAPLLRTRQDIFEYWRTRIIACRVFLR